MDSGVFAAPGNPNAWREFAIASARSQSANLAGVMVGMGIGAAAALAVTSAPLLIVIGWPQARAVKRCSMLLG
jgi:hypothetical protein